MEPSEEQAFNNIAEEYFQAKLKPIRNVYIDIEVLQDFKIGALLNLITTQAEYDYILYRIAEYSKRITDETMRYFPIIKNISDEDLDAFIVDKENHRKLVVISPTTNFFMGIPDMIRHINEANTRSPHENKHVHFHIGTNSVILDQDLKNNILFQFKKFDNTLNITIYNRPLSEMEEALIKNIDITVIENIKRFTHDPIIRKHLSDSAFFDKRILAYPYIDVEPIKGETVDQLLNNTKVMLDVYCDFDYIERKVELKG
jgi:hypothetical protein